MKRCFDLFFAALALMLLGIPFLFLAWQVRRKLGSPVFFRQTRPGLREQPFQMVKFRSMTDARGPDGVLLPDSARLTPFGLFLRSSS
jgi:lipopolysaccharide/colanic/teichoic acid biosynthesis glycosyltransferase